ncbi:ABC transporter [Shewanella maritima]|uniref:Transport permease protein n=1 Tax=Shewanella maritima TaxID=2520507 RepID=A0A411PEB5_9GAMM|nr:ABC transporter permease [Shewanella maritima]QBF81881.1 ABC transporter [Shewanella maritima]
MTTLIKRNNWQVWKDVVFALFVREIRTGFNDKFGLAWAVINPVVFIFALAYGRSLISGPETHSMPGFTFMALGLLMIQLFLEVLNNTSNAIKKNKALYAFRQVQPISGIIASGVFQLLVKLVAMLVIALLMFLMGIELRFDNPLLMLSNILMLWLIAMSIGCTFAIMACYVEEMQKVLSLLSRPLFFISCVFFSLQDVPREYWPYLNWNPIAHAIELTRYGAYTSYGLEGVSQLFLAMCTLTTVFLACCSYFVSWKQAISR